MFWLLNKCKKYNAGVFGRVKEGGDTHQGEEA
jgi:hypothetical protein